VEVSNDAGDRTGGFWSRSTNFSRGARSSERTYASRHATSAICGSPSCRTNTALACHINLAEALQLTHTPVTSAERSPALWTLWTI